MSLFNVGRICLKIAGRDAGRTCVVVEELDNNYVLVDGDVRRKKVNTKHLEPLDQSIEIRKGVAHEEIQKVFAKLNWKTWEHQSKSVAAKPNKQRTVKEKPVEEKKPKVKPAKEKPAQKSEH